MSTAGLPPLGFWRTVSLLLRAARKRSRGRRRRQQELLQQRSKRKSTNWTSIGVRLSILLMAGLNVMAAFVLQNAVNAAQRVEAEHAGKIVVSRHFLYEVKQVEKASAESAIPEDQFATPDYGYEAMQIADNYGGDRRVIEQKLRDSVREHGARDFIAKDAAIPGLRALQRTGRFPAMIGSLVLLWWAIMLVCQGEGLELDLQRRRHPMWEWLFSHPVRAGPVFFAEMLAPIAANPIYWGGPLFVGVLYGLIYGPRFGLVAAFLIGVPVIVALACLGKALEIGITLRFPPRSRGAMIGIMSWLGYASMMLFFVGLFAVPKIVSAAGGLASPLAAVPWPWLGLFLGQAADSFSFAQGVSTCWLSSALLAGFGVSFSVWGANRGLSGNFGETNLPRVKRGGARFGKEPLYRKEFLWFMRDRSAIVQTILVPVTVAGFQVFNMRGLLSQAQGAWNYLCGIGILFGTYFLWVLGPKSLSSEGSALWIALTWPRGLESLLKAKAWLWSLLSSTMVMLVLCYAAFLYPHEIWKIAIVGAAWFFFGRSMAEKTVTLVTTTSESGEQQKIPWGRRWAAQLGMLTFAIGVFTQQWHIAIMGIVYSYITAAAMWQNFRARLPYLYDPWSEELPPAPTLMHAMVAISILVEAGAIITGIVIAIAGRENLAVAQAVSYGICAVAVSVGVWNFLGNRGVANREVWRWPGADDAGNMKSWRVGDQTRWKAFSLALGLGAIAGFVLAMVAHEYIAVLRHIPQTAELLRKSQEQLAKIPNLRLSYAVMAVLFAPFAEEYLFRGLLFRALDREWGGWRAVVGSAAFFAVYHPPISWLPVFLLGASNAVLFKKTGRLLPAVFLHMVYNAVVMA